ncbi:transporter [Trypanosoma grayi]|uniref:transporter n=1 Tax=Trypanosoma grayi TaxID=71804 RepID=UPI0004F436F3|nr:transporter [Trypanosoma grayi]KEG10577.1 transporter [Trypanosoma grayi]
MSSPEKFVRFSVQNQAEKDIVVTPARNGGVSAVREVPVEDEFGASQSGLEGNDWYGEDESCVGAEDVGGAATRSSQLFESEGPVALPLSCAQESLARRINFLKKWYLLMHVLYIMSLVLFGSLLFYVLESGIAFVDAFFIAMSSVCCCGLQTVDVSGWKVSSNLLRHFLMIGGGIVFTSAHQPLLRVWMLKKIWGMFDRHPSDTLGERALRASKRLYAERLWYTSVICAVTPFMYLTFVNGTLMAILRVFNRSNLRGLEVFEMTIASFHSSIFLSMEPYAADAVVVLVVTIGCALGFTLFPVVLRIFLHAEWFVFRLLVCVYVRFQKSRATDRRNSVFMFISEDSPLLLNAPVHQVGYLFRESDMKGEVVGVNAWERGFRDVLASKQPASFHAFLFVRSETLYLGVAWLAITLAQAAPFWFQQWSGEGLLAPFSTPYKIFLSVSQAAVVRFAAASFVSCLEYSNAHIAMTILCMFLPALPISTDRTYRKWKQMFRTSVVRLLTSRLFWLFTAMLSILFAEQDGLIHESEGTRFDAMTRSLFEVISAFAGCGLSLSLLGSPVSFVGSLGTFSKLVIAAVMLGGRHRTVDLGIDLGFAVLQADERPHSGVGARRPSVETAAAYRILKGLRTSSNDDRIGMGQAGSVQTKQW